MSDLPSISFLRGSDIAQSGLLCPPSGLSGRPLLRLQTSPCLDWASPWGCQQQPNHRAVSSLLHLNGPGPWTAERQLATQASPWARCELFHRPGGRCSADGTSTIRPHTSLNSSARGVCVASPPLPATTLPRSRAPQGRRKLQSRDTFHCKRTRSGRSRQGWICTGSRTIWGPAIVMRMLPLCDAGAPASLERLLPGWSGEVFVN